jgi:tripartite-type tricarboxylate transporter receptor subunit TctC
MRTILFAVAVAAACPALAQPYPAKAIRFVVPFPASGATDILTRVIGQKLSEAVGQPVVIENRPGAGGALGSAFVAKAPPDGYMILMGTTSTHSIGPALQKLPYDPASDFAPVSLIANAIEVLVVSPALDVSSVGELIALARAKPGQLNYSSSGTGTIVHLSGELFKIMAGVELQHVPYKGTALAIPDLFNGQIALMFDNMVSAIPFIRSGKVKAIAVTSTSRSSILPGLPTVSESGVPGYESVAYFGVLAPAGTPAEIVARLNAELVNIVHAADTKAKLADLGAEPEGSTAEAFAATMKAEALKWAKVIKDAGIRAE